MVCGYGYVRSCDFLGDRVADFVAGDEGLNVVVADIFQNQTVPSLVARNGARFDARYRAVTVDHHRRRPTADAELRCKTVGIPHHREGVGVVRMEVGHDGVGIGGGRIIAYGYDFDRIAVLLVRRLHGGHFPHAPAAIRTPVVNDERLLRFQNFRNAALPGLAVYGVGRRERVVVEDIADYVACVRGIAYGQNFGSQNQIRFAFFGGKACGTLCVPARQIPSDRRITACHCGERKHAVVVRNAACNVQAVSVPYGYGVLFKEKSAFAAHRNGIAHAYSVAQGKNRRGGFPRNAPRTVRVDVAVGQVGNGYGIIAVVELARSDPVFVRRRGARDCRAVRPGRGNALGGRARLVRNGYGIGYLLYGERQHNVAHVRAYRSGGIGISFAEVFKRNRIGAERERSRRSSFRVRRCASLLFRGGIPVYRNSREGSFGGGENGNAVIRFCSRTDVARGKCRRQSK